MGSRFSCVTPGIMRFFLDLLRAVKKRECTFEVGYEGLSRL